jgi:hypothetical protein
MPGLSVTVGEQIEALRKVAGENVVKRIRRQPDARIAKIVDQGRDELRGHHPHSHRG